MDHEPGGSPPPVRYRSWDDDSDRWRAVRHRDGDIVISTRSKCGTTWMQMICALLVFQRPDLPAPLGTLSPWIDHLVVPIDEVVAAIESQGHRRVLKTHTPLDGLPLDPRVTYVVVGRHPLDMAASAYHQAHNLDRERVARLAGNAPPAAGDRPEDGTLVAWLHRFIEWDGDRHERLDSLPGVAWHLGDAWVRRLHHPPDVVLVHYADLERDLAGEMHRLAHRLGIEVPVARWPTLVAAAGFDAMRQRSDELAPDPAGILRDRAAFFHGGRSGTAAAALTPADVARYEERTARLLPDDLRAWVHRGRRGCDPDER